MYVNTTCKCIYLIWTWYKQRNTCILSYIHVCTVSVQGIFLSVHGSSRFVQSHTINMQFLSLPKVFPWGMPFERVCTAFVISINNAMVQEFAILYMQCSYPLRMALAGGQLSCSIYWKTSTYAYVSCCTWLNRVYWCLYTKYENPTGKLTTCQSHS